MAAFSDKITGSTDLSVNYLTFFIPHILLSGLKTLAQTAFAVPTELRLTGTVRPTDQFSMGRQGDASGGADNKP